MGLAKSTAGDGPALTAQFRPPRQEYCVKLAQPCTFSPRRKPGPNSSRPKKISWKLVETESSSSASDGGDQHGSESDSAVPPAPPPPDSDSLAAEEPAVHPVVLLNAAEVIEAASSPALPVAPVAVLPDEFLVNYLVGTYLSQLYPTNPHTIKCELLAELQTPSGAPDFYVASLALWAARWDSQLLMLAGGHAGRALLFQSLYSRLTTTLLPALEWVLTGYDSLRGKAAKAAYRRTAIQIVISLFHLAGIAIAYPYAAATTFQNFQTIMGLVLAVVRAAKLRVTRLHGKNASGLAPPVWKGDFFSPTIERFRRVWWGFVVVDNMQSAMYDSDPSIPWSECRGVATRLSDFEYESVRAVLGDVEPEEADITEWDSNAIDSLDELEDVEGPGSSGCYGSVEGFSTTGSSPQAGPFIEHSDDVILTAPLTTSIFDGKLDYFTSVVRITQLISLAGKYRRLVPQPYLDRPGRLHIESQIESVLHEWPLEWTSNLPEKLHAVKHLLGTEQAVEIVHLAYNMLDYHAAMCLINSPPEDMLWRSEVDMTFLASAAFIKAQKHADCATQLLIPLVEASGTAPQMCLSFFQWCVVRTGILHHAFLQASRRVWEGAGAQDLIETAKSRIAIHARALAKAQGGIGADRKSWWFEAWSSVTGT